MASASKRPFSASTTAPRDLLGSERLGVVGECRQHQLLQIDPRHLDLLGPRAAI